ncbi:hypothetical protein [Phytohabitans aurantiacus]|uniref:Uncharacterized protein n=1 Tax=Phytohabitans aurantiacus TaxID=3016789 RepID=A0ABQ5RAL7_9ACTN|nr:hypothetical protein [Phytohabitans aurantiacus]GLI03796.1 hypothetical protein Pa4123_90760 [Phytohabitans aurantiacus]
MLELRGEQRPPSPNVERARRHRLSMTIDIVGKVAVASASIAQAVHWIEMILDHIR